MGMLNECEITRLCSLATVLVASPADYRMLIAEVLDPNKNALSSWPGGKLAKPKRSQEFRKTMQFMKRSFAQLSVGPMTMVRLALRAEKMCKRNGPAADAGRAILWAIQSLVAQDLRTGANKISKQDKKIIHDAIERVARR